ncbi:MAG: hypothetical protein KA244_02885, partial [Deltaproteobacteria bacterium]|nr:hypothetical protein [Deltaproteobacteria bacterium]
MDPHSVSASRATASTSSSAARPIDRVVMIVLDSCGCGSAPDAARYGDVGANTLGNLSRQQGGLSLPNLASLGLGNLTALQGVPQVRSTRGSYGLMRERSAGKDTTTGHWEIAGVQVDTAFPTFPQGFPKEMLDRFTA